MPLDDTFPFVPLSQENVRIAMGFELKEESSVVREMDELTERFREQMKGLAARPRSSDGTATSIPAGFTPAEYAEIEQMAIDEEETKRRDVRGGMRKETARRDKKRRLKHGL